MQKDPEVTIIIPAYEAAGFIGGAIETCLAQTGVSFEVIVVDDGSRESSEAAVKVASGGDDRIRFCQLAVNGGPSAARNKALDLARGQFVAVLDADDAMEPDRLARMVRTAEKSSADIVVDNVIRWNFDDPEAEETLLLKRGGESGPLEIDLLTYMDPASNERFGAPLGYLKPLFRRDFIEAHGLRYDLRLRNSEDYYFVANMLALGARMVLAPFAGYRYAIRENSLSHRITPAQAYAIIEAEQRFQARLAGKMPGDIVRASERRIAMFRRMAEFETLAGALKERKWGAAFSAATGTPANTFAHLTRLSAIMLSKIG